MILRTPTANPTSKYQAQNFSRDSVKLGRAVSGNGVFGSWAAAVAGCLALLLLVAAAGCAALAVCFVLCSVVINLPLKGFARRHC